jgi:hypothetical protein
VQKPPRCEYECTVSFPIARATIRMRACTCFPGLHCPSFGSIHMAANLNQPQPSFRYLSFPIRCSGDNTLFQATAPLDLKAKQFQTHELFCFRSFPFVLGRCIQETKRILNVYHELVSKDGEVVLCRANASFVIVFEYLPETSFFSGQRRRNARQKIRNLQVHTLENTSERYAMPRTKR